MIDYNTNSSQTTINVRMQYPYSDLYEYETKLVRLDLDQERINDIKTGRGFIIESSDSIRNDVKNQTGIFSSRYGSTVADIDSFNGKYRCDCGMTKGSIMHGEICPVCHTKVIFKDDDVSIFGWLVLKDKYFVIHPNLYSSLECFIGPTRMSAIIKPIVNVDSDGKIITIGEPNMKKDEPFRGIGMIAFKERFQEIMDYYYNKWPNKKPIYDDLMLNKNIIFTHSIPVFSALLRPSILESGSINTSPISW